ncbi:MAG: DUF533 domain-containing protein [Planctomycetota bacterium]
MLKNVYLVLDDRCSNFVRGLPQTEVLSFAVSCIRGSAPESVQDVMRWMERVRAVPSVVQMPGAFETRRVAVFLAELAGDDHGWSLTSSEVLVKQGSTTFGGGFAIALVSDKPRMKPRVMEQPLSHLKIRRASGVSVVEFADCKTLEELSIQEIGEELNHLVESESGIKLLLNFKNVDHLSSAALGMLITLDRRIKVHNGELKVSDINRQIFEAFKITNLNRVFDIHETCDQALSDFQAVKRITNPNVPASAPEIAPTAARVDPKKARAVAIMRILIAVARADGVIDEREKRVLRGFVAKLRITREEFQALAREKSIVNIADLPSDRDGRLSLLTDVFSLALADGTIAPEEQSLLERLAKGLGVGAEDLESCLCTARERVSPPQRPQTTEDETRIDRELVQEAIDLLDKDDYQGAARILESSEKLRQYAQDCREITMSWQQGAVVGQLQSVLENLSAHDRTSSRQRPQTPAIQETKQWKKKRRKEHTTPVPVSADNEGRAGRFKSANVRLRCRDCLAVFEMDDAASKQFREADVVMLPPCPKCGGERTPVV